MQRPSRGQRTAPITITGSKAQLWAPIIGRLPRLSGDIFEYSHETQSTVRFDKIYFLIPGSVTLYRILGARLVDPGKLVNPHKISLRL
jgi:hypothetical protein